MARAVPSPSPTSQRLYARLAWTTVARLPLIAPRRRAATETHLILVCRGIGLEPVEVCAFRDRVHLLVRFDAGLALADAVRRIQAASEEVLNAAGHPVRWSRAWAAATVSPEEVRDMRRRMARRRDGWVRPPPRRGGRDGRAGGRRAGPDRTPTR